MEPFFHTEVQSQDAARDRLVPLIIAEHLAQIKIADIRWRK